MYIPGSLITGNGIGRGNGDGTLISSSGGGVGGGGGKGGGGTVNIIRECYKIILIRKNFLDDFKFSKIVKNFFNDTYLIDLIKSKRICVTM